jgi:TPR repeat protein
VKNFILSAKNHLFYLFIAVLYMQSPILIAEQNTIQRDSWYISQPDESATIQMSAHETEEAAIAFINSLNLSGDIGYYQTTYKNMPWFAVTYGRFNTLAEARSHLKSLPDDLLKHSPWPRTFSVIKSLIDVADDAADSSQQEESSVNNTVQASFTWEEGQAAYDEGDYNKAFMIWQVLANQGDELSQFNLGVMYNRGEGTEKSGSKTIEWYMRSAEQGYAPAQFNLGAAYLDGSSGVVDKQKAAAWWQMAAEQGFVQAQFNIASLYCRGIGVSRSMEQCKFWYRRAASNGDIHARKMLDHILESEKKEAASENTVVSDYESQSDSESLAKESSANVDDELASIAEESLHEEEQSKKWQQASEVRRITSQEQAMLAKAQSAFTRNNYLKAHDIWLPLAESEIAEAQYSLGFLYQSGLGPERDTQKAVAWYSNAAEQNEARAQFNLGVLLLKGDDNVEKDVETGVLWLIRSAENNNIRAKEFLIGLYSKGKYGIVKSKEKADYWKSR